MTMEDWEPGKHVWLGIDCPTCGTRRLDNVDFFIYRMPESLDSIAREVWERACPPCRPRTKVARPGLHTAKQACELMGMARGTFVNRVAVRWMRPFAVLVPRTYLWSDGQLELIAMLDAEWNEIRRPVISAQVQVEGLRGRNPRPSRTPSGARRRS